MQFGEPMVCIWDACGMHAGSLCGVWRVFTIALAHRNHTKSNAPEEAGDDVAEEESRGEAAKVDQAEGEKDNEDTAEQKAPK